MGANQVWRGEVSPPWLSRFFALFGAAKRILCSAAPAELAEAFIKISDDMKQQSLGIDRGASEILGYFLKRKMYFK